MAWPPYAVHVRDPSDRAGEILRRAREISGLTIDDVAASLKVRASIIEGIEANDFTLCGGSIYAKGHVRQMAKIVGVDPEAVLAEVNWSEWES